MSRKIQAIIKKAAAYSAAHPDIRVKDIARKFGMCTQTLLGERRKTGLLRPRRASTQSILTRRIRKLHRLLAEVGKQRAEIKKLEALCPTKTR
jgi:transposase-like protein